MVFQKGWKSKFENRARGRNTFRLFFYDCIDFFNFCVGSGLKYDVHYFDISGNKTWEKCESEKELEDFKTKMKYQGLEIIRIYMLSNL